MTFAIGFLLTVQALTCVFLILIILMQPSKADGGLGAAFGGGATDTLFGARTGNVLTKGTIWGATILFVTSVLLAILIALPVGIYAATRPYSLFDQVASTLTFIGFSLPTFFTVVITRVKAPAAAGLTISASSPY